MASQVLEAPRFSEVALGDRLPEVRLEVAQEAIDRFAVASLDLNPVHIDPEWCARARVFDDLPVLHGMHSMALMTSVVYRSWGALAQVRSIDAKFTKPTPAGETLTASGIVTETHHVAPGRNYVVAEVKAVDSGGDTVGVSRIEIALPD